jgi:hypothetical protein
MMSLVQSALKLHARMLFTFVFAFVILRLRYKKAKARDCYDRFGYLKKIFIKKKSIEMIVYSLT